MEPVGTGPSRLICFITLAFIAVVLTSCGTPTHVSGGPVPVPQLLYATGQSQILAYNLDSSTGALTPAGSTPGPNTEYATSTSIAAYPSGKFLFAADTTGDAIVVYSINGTTGALTQAGSSFSTAPFDGLRGLATDSSGSLLYVSGFSGVAGFKVDTTGGALSEVAGSPFLSGDNPLGVVADPAAPYIYTIDYPPDTVGSGTQALVSGFSVGSNTGSLAPVTGSPYSVSTIDHPFFLSVDPAGKFLYAGVPSAGVVEGWTINSATGALTPIPGSQLVLVGGATAINPNGKFLYVPAGSAVYAFAINPTTGVLTQITGSPFLLPVTQPLLSGLYTDVSGQFMYSPAQSASNASGIVGLNVDGETGAVTVLNGSPFAAGATLTTPATLVTVLGNP